MDRTDFGRRILRFSHAVRPSVTHGLPEEVRRGDLDLTDEATGHTPRVELAVLGNPPDEELASHALRAAEDLLQRGLKIRCPRFLLDHDFNRGLGFPDIRLV